MTNSTYTARPFKVLGIQQIAIGAPNKQRLKALWVDMLGLEMTGTFQSERETSMKIFAPSAAARSRWKLT